MNLTHILHLPAVDLYQSGAEIIRLCEYHKLSAYLARIKWVFSEYHKTKISYKHPNY